MKYDEGRADRIIASRGCWKFWNPQSTLKLGITQTGLVSTGYNRKIGTSVGNTVGTTYNLLKDARGRAGRKDLGNNEQVVFEGIEIGKSA